MRNILLCNNVFLWNVNIQYWHKTQRALLHLGAHKQAFVLRSGTMIMMVVPYILTHKFQLPINRSSACTSITSNVSRREYIILWGLLWCLCDRAHLLWCRFLSFVYFDACVCVRTEFVSLLVVSHRSHYWPFVWCGFFVYRRINIHTRSLCQNCQRLRPRKCSRTYCIYDWSVRW